MERRRPPCVSCGTSTRRGKVLKCLDVVCLECLEVCVSASMDVKCPKCRKVTPAVPGCSIFNSLPDSDLGTVATSATTAQGVAGQMERWCEECLVDKLAVARCMDCRECYCSEHCKAHKTSRKYFQHKLVSLAHSSAAADIGPTRAATHRKCSIHALSTVSSFCTKCNQLACELCLKAGVHAEHPTSVRSINDAAKTVRRLLLADVRASQTGSRSVLETALSVAETSISKVKDNVETVSSQIHEYCEQLRACISAKEEELLKEVDVRSDKILEPMEEHRRRALLALEKTANVEQFAQEGLDNVNFLVMSKWLADAKLEIGTSTAGICAPRGDVLSTLTFHATGETELKRAIRSTGMVDCERGLDPIRSELICCASAGFADAQRRVGICVAMSEGTPPSSFTKLIKSLEVKVTNSDGRDSILSLSASPGISDRNAADVPQGCQLVASFTPSKPDRLTVSAAYKSVQLKGSPLTYVVKKKAPSTQFDPFECHPGLTLSSDCLTVTHDRDRHCFRGVRTGPLPTHQGTIQISIDHLDSDSQETILLLCSRPNLNILSAHKPGYRYAFGWSSFSRICADWHTNALGQPWRTGDVVTLTFDRTRQTLTGHHSRTGARNVLRDLEDEHYYLLVVVQAMANQVTILPS